MRVIETTLDDDLAALSAHLWSVGIAHRIFEERGRQVVEVMEPRQADAVRTLHAAWRAGRLAVAKPPGTEPDAPGPGLAARLVGHLRRYPVLTFAVVLAGLLLPTGLALGNGRMSALGAALLVVDPARAATGTAPLALLLTVEAWRWLTPVFLHFSVVHLAFNCVIVLELGRRIEGAIGSRRFVVLFAALGVAGNLAQYLQGGGILFGGLSGVGYGLLGFILVRQRLEPERACWRLPAGLGPGLLVFLVVFSTGVTELFGLHVANAAHWAGLLAGAIGAWLMPGDGWRRTVRD